MAVTAKGTPYVESSDLVANYPGVSLALANHIDTIGKVLQVVYASSVSNTTTSGTTFVTTNVTGTITPSKTSSKILIMVAVQLSNQTSNTGDFTIFRGTVAGTNLGPAAGFGRLNTVSQSTAALQTAIFLDDPNTTSAQVYTVAMKGTTGGFLTANNANPGTITLMEIGA